MLVNFVLDEQVICVQIGLPKSLGLTAKGSVITITHFVHSFCFGDGMAGGAGRHKGWPVRVHETRKEVRPMNG